MSFLGLGGGNSDPYNASQFLGDYEAGSRNAQGMWGQLGQLGTLGATQFENSLGQRQGVLNNFLAANDPNTFWTSDRVNDFVNQATAGTDQAAANIEANNDLSLQQRGLAGPSAGGVGSIQAGANTSLQQNLINSYANARNQLRMAQINSIPTMYQNQLGALNGVTNEYQGLATGALTGAGQGFGQVASNAGQMYGSAIQGDQSVAQAEGAGIGGLFGGLATLGGAWIGRAG